MSSSTSISRINYLARCALGVMASALVTFLALEGGLRMLPVVGGVHRADPQSDHASARLEPHREYTNSMGWDLRHVVHGRTNESGFLSPHEYVAGRRAVALLGDSFVEAQMLRYEESLAGHLDALWKGRARTYNFGLSGASLPHYLGMAKEMGARFRFDAAVIVVTPGDYVEGFERQEGLYSWDQASPGDLIELVPASRRGGLQRMARELATVRYVRSNMKLSLGRMLPAPPKVCAPGLLTAADRERLSRYVTALPEALGLAPARAVLVFNASTGDVYERVDRGRQVKARCPDLDTQAIIHLRELALARGMKIVDVGPALERHYRMHRRRLDFSPVDAHWNGLASSVIADEVYEALAPRRMHARRPAASRVANR
jgi:hypothetical protein